MSKPKSPPLFISPRDTLGLFLLTGGLNLNPIEEKSIRRRLSKDGRAVYDAWSSFEPVRRRKCLAEQIELLNKQRAVFRPLMRQLNRASFVFKISLKHRGLLNELDVNEAAIRPPL